MRAGCHQSGFQIRRVTGSRAPNVGAQLRRAASEAGGSSVSAVAAASGYASDSAFSAMLKAAMGQPPSHLQNKKSLSRTIHARELLSKS